jgi:CRISPR-associated exonuclease Cas4
MDGLIQISKLNDFLYSPKSLYFHTAFEDFNKQVYHENAQQVGLEKHKTIDQQTYSDRKDVKQGITVYSEEFGLIGKIDLYFEKSATLVERKTKIKEIFPGYKMQIYAQYFCLVEMGYEVNQLEFYSMQDNKKYPIPLPDYKDKKVLKNLIQQIKDYDPMSESQKWKTTNVDDKTIYNSLYF